MPPRGKLVSGRGPPLPEVGKRGDVYVDWLTGALHGPKRSHGWPPNSSSFSGGTTSLVADTGSARGRTVRVVGGDGIATSAAGSTLTIAATGGGSGGGGLTWTEVTGDSQVLVGSHGYVANYAGQTTFTLPAPEAAEVGTTVRVVGVNNDTGWKIAQNDGQTIRFGNVTTTTGTGGSLASKELGDAVELLCVASDTFIVVSAVGNITYV